MRGLQRAAVSLAGVAALLALVDCASAPPPAPKSPDQAYYDATAAYVAGLVIVTNYGKQPLCPGNTWGLACANGPALIAAKKASDAASAALGVAGPAVDAWKASQSSSDATKAAGLISAAVSEVAAVQALVTQIKAH